MRREGVGDGDVVHLRARRVRRVDVFDVWDLLERRLPRGGRRLTDLGFGRVVEDREREGQLFELPVTELDRHLHAPLARPLEARVRGVDDVLTGRRLRHRAGIVGGELYRDETGIALADEARLLVIEVVKTKVNLGIHDRSVVFVCEAEL